MVTSEKTRRSKVVSLQEAASLIKDGMALGMGGGHSREAPCAFARELIRRGVKDLTLIPTNSSAYQTDILLGAGCVKTLYMSYVGLDYIGAAPNFRRLAESGKLDIVEFDEMGLLRGLKAAAAGVGFFPLPDGMRAVDVVRTNPDFYKEIDNPFTGKKVVVVPPIVPDIAVVHVAKCDAYGNARELGIVEDILHRAAKKVIVTTEEIVSLEDTRAHYKEVTIFGRFVDAVVEVPYGGHPGPCSGCYQLDEEHLREYQKAARDEASFKKYLDEYVYGPKNHEEYLEKIGIARKLLKLKYY
jgi:glutaconate CoA-transferase subunit A